MRNSREWAGRLEPPLGLTDVISGGNALILLRWLALVLALVLASFDYFQEGVLLEPGYTALIIACYNLALVTAGRGIQWLRRPLNFLAVDALVATGAVYLTGGHHSGFFVLFIYIVIGAALYIELVPTLLLSLVTALVYAGACAANPAGLSTSAAIYSMAIKLLFLLLTSSCVALTLAGLRREHQKTETERLQIERMSVLNNLLQSVTASLDVDRTLQTLADAARELLRTDVALVLLRDQAAGELYAAAVSGADLTQASGLRISMAHPEVQSILADAGSQTIAASGSGPFASWMMLPGEEIRATAISPLRLEDDLLGVLIVGRHQPDCIEDSDLPLLQALAQEAALAIRNSRLYERERNQAEQLRLMEQVQRHFISSVAHELRTPLTCIRTSVDLLLSAPAPEVQQELCHTIDHHRARLDAFVTDLLECTRLEVGQTVLTRQPTDLRLIVQRTVDVMAPLHQQRGQRLDVTMPEEPMIADVDRRRIEQVLTNLLANAHKFAPRGGHIWVVLGRQDGECVISVADDGPGISREHQSHLFQRFYTVPGSTGKTGTGLGLYITRELVELHGGHTWVVSEPGEGSTFFIAVPAARGVHE